MTPHPFSHIGPAPYRFLGIESTEDRVGLNAQRAAHGETFTTNMCGGSCDHCGTAIWTVFRFQAADGKRFKVGSTCVAKASKQIAYDYDPTLIKAVKAARKLATTARHTREAAKVAQVRAWLDANRAQLVALPHPQAQWHPEETAADWAEWLWERSGISGRLRLQKKVQALLNASL